jgi:molybdenum-dependent DNA-binding transcriptional regulator ModE
MKTKTSKGMKRGQAGGRAVVAKYGREYMIELGKVGAQVTHTKYKLEKWGLNDFAMVDRETGQIKTWLFGANGRQA